MFTQLGNDGSTQISIPVCMTACLPENGHSRSGPVRGQRQRAAWPCPGAKGPVLPPCQQQSPLELIVGAEQERLLVVAGAAEAVGAREAMGAPAPGGPGLYRPAGKARKMWWSLAWDKLHMPASPT